MARKRATLTDLLNDLTFRTIYEKYKMIARTRFEWSGLDEIGLDEKFIERYLYYHGKAIFFRDPEMNYMCLRAMDTGKLNVYGEPLQYTAVGFNYRKDFSSDDCIIIENNPLRIETDKFIMLYANKLTEADRTMDVNVKSCKTPYIIACDDKDVLTFKRIFSMIDGNIPAIYADKGLNLDALNVLKTDSKFIGNELMDYKKSVENELLTFLGLNNLPVDKKERVNVAETESNNEITESFCDLQLRSRQLACDRINEKYGLKVSVKKKDFQQGGVENVEKSALQHNEINA